MGTCFYGIGSPEVLKLNLSDDSPELMENFKRVCNTNANGLCHYLMHLKPAVAGRLVRFNTETGKPLPKSEQPKRPFFEGWNDTFGLGLLKADAAILGTWIVHETRPGKKAHLQFHNHAVFSTFTTIRKDTLKHANSEGFCLQEVAEEWIPDRRNLRYLGKWMIKSGGFFMT